MEQCTDLYFTHLLCLQDPTSLSTMWPVILIKNSSWKWDSMLWTLSNLRFWCALRLRWEFDEEKFRPKASSLFEQISSVLYCSKKKTKEKGKPSHFTAVLVYCHIGTREDNSFFIYFYIYHASNYFSHVTFLSHIKNSTVKPELSKAKFPQSPKTEGCALLLWHPETVHTLQLSRNWPVPLLLYMCYYCT